LKDISDRDAALLNAAQHVDSSSSSLDFNPYYLANKAGHGVDININKLQVTTIYIELPDNYMGIFVYFNWRDNKAYWQDGFTIFGLKGFELLNGTLLFQQNGIDYTAPIPRLKCQNVNSKNMFGSEESRQIFGAVSYPFHSEKQRGYVFYQLKLPDKPYAGGNCINYVHNRYPFQFPYAQTEKQIINGSYFFSDRVKQQYTNFDYK
jgi:hypothetical protein